MTISAVVWVWITKTLYLFFLEGDLFPKYLSLFFCKWLVNSGRQMQTAGRWFCVLPATPLENRKVISNSSFNLIMQKTISKSCASPPLSSSKTYFQTQCTGGNTSSNLLTRCLVHLLSWKKEIIRPIRNLKILNDNIFYWKS